MYASTKTHIALGCRSNPLPRACTLSALCLVLVLVVTTSAQTLDDISQWTIYITNDNCPDYTWGLTEMQTRKSFADIVRGHLDLMSLTDKAEPHNQDRYNMAVTQEALCFVEHYPARQPELVRRIKQGRIFVSPYLCNSLWAFQSLECAIRTFYPARRLERDWAIQIDVAEHIEQPSLPWGVASILAGCGVRWLSVPYYGYDSMFAGLSNPPIFTFEGPDGATVRVVMDRWASARSSYTQGAHLLRNPHENVKDLLAHYAGLGQTYPMPIILASGTHGDIFPKSGDQAHGFAKAIAGYNSQPQPHPKLVNATLPQFCHSVDQVQQSTPFLPTLRGCFGHSWDLWPVSLAKYVADMRQGERTFLAAEALLAIAAHTKPQLQHDTRADRQRAEWCWSMLSDHAWNGTDDKNKAHNAQLRQNWSRQLNQLGDKLLQQGWAGAGLRPSLKDITIFNSLSFPRAALGHIEPPPDVNSVVSDHHIIACQLVTEPDKRMLYFVSPEVAPFGFEHLSLSSTPATNPDTDKLQITPTRLENNYYRLTVDTETGGISSLIHKATGTELVVSDNGRTLGQTLYFDGREHTARNVNTEIVASGPVLARLKISSTVANITVTNFVTIYAELDQLDLDFLIDKPPTTERHRLCHVFPVLGQRAVLRIETTGAVIRPRPQPRGDLLPGADTRRFVVQGFVDASAPKGPGVTIAPLDAFALRMDLDPITFEALGNDQNYREVTRDQHGISRFRFRYRLRAHATPYQNADAFEWSRHAAFPLHVAFGSLSQPANTAPAITVDPQRAIATSLKPPDDDSPGSILRLWEIAGRSDELEIALNGYSRAVRTDLLERDRKPLEIVDNKVKIKPNPYGFCALRLVP